MSINTGIATAAAGAPSPAAVADYDGTTPFTDDAGPPATFQGRVRAGVTATIVAVPFAGLGVAVWLAWGRGLNLADVLMAVVFYGITGLGVTIGFSPYRYGASLAGQLRGLAHAHAGWLLRDDPTPPERYAPDMTADRSMRAVSAAFPALCALSLALPFGAGWLIGGSWRTALLGLLWAGLVRVTVLQHVTWSVNSLCHVFGNRPFATRRHDRATNLWPLALVSFGESWHNMHHSDPACARHGAEPGQIDISASVIRVFERLGWATGVHWPDPDRLAARRR